MIAKKSTKKAKSNGYNLNNIKTKEKKEPMKKSRGLNAFFRSLGLILVLVLFWLFSHL